MKVTLSFYQSLDRLVQARQVVTGQVSMDVTEGASTASALLQRRLG